VRSPLPPLRAVIADDELLLREGVARLLEEAGIEVVARAADAPELLRKVRGHKPDVAIIDVRMPPDLTDDGLRAAVEIRREQPEVGVLMFSQHLVERYVNELVGDDARGVGYVLKHRIADLGYFIDAVDHVTAEAIVDGMRTRPAEPSFILLEALTGQARREPEGGAAFGQRAARWNASALAIWEDPAHDEAQIGWARRVAAGLAPASRSGAGYANYASPDETAERVRANYGPERFARLAAVKRRYDPENVFRHNENITP